MVLEDAALFIDQNSAALQKPAELKFGWGGEPPQSTQNPLMASGRNQAWCLRWYWMVTYLLAVAMATVQFLPQHTNGPFPVLFVWRSSRCNIS